ncbi:RNA-binding protein [Vagococcus xieshaowenii]|uniref:RNA-binding protein n=1 Tax=Vagococcus xieshaowenii TaxID=2562451 RepID=A0AAJ5JLY2_9ENTE|nr:RNA-binding protein [Vagococcus xieshaowenii]QCA29610.1 RNA-binding protein [Vagococcus xieshaowenii]TFZ43179.1 RNA-binding protein [Vagococcus xieshaowenii]
MEKNVYQHFRKDEHPFIDMVENWAAKVEREYAPFLTGFLDPRQFYILESIVRNQSQGLKISSFGGYEGAERVKALIYPDYYEPEIGDYEVLTFNIEYPKKFTQLKHSQILGTLMSLGIKRELFGDITTDGDSWQIHLDEKMASFVNGQFDKVGKVAIRLEIARDAIIIPINEWETSNHTVSSQRLDAVISEVFNISRQRSKSLVESGKIKVNWMLCERVDTLVEAFDMISVRGFGRIRIDAIEGRTKKDRIRINVSMINNKR